MNRFVLWLSTAGLAAVAVTGCRSGGSASGSGYVPKKPPQVNSNGMVAAGQEATYFPFAVGNQWTFDSEISQSVNGRTAAPVKQEITYRISQVTNAPNGGKDAWFAVIRDEKVIDRQIWRIDSTGIYQVAIGVKMNRFSSPQLILPIPLKAGATYKWKGSIKADTGEVRTGTNDGTVVGPEPIDTDMGTYNAVAIESKGTLDAPNTKSRIASRLWLIPNVGIGRYRQEALGVITSKDPKMKGRTAQFLIIQVMKLKNYSLKK